MPGLQSALELLGEDLGIAGGLEDLLRNLAGDLMMAVAVGNAAQEGGDNHLRTFAPDGQHRVVEHTLMAPFGKGFLLSF